MWLVSGIDEEHRFREWADAAAFYRQIVEDWVAANGGAAEGVDDLRPGDSQQIQFSAGSGEKVRFGLTWEVGGGRMDHFVAC
jgi:hypothetical protein